MRDKFRVWVWVSVKGAGKGRMGGRHGRARRKGGERVKGGWWEGGRRWEGGWGRKEVEGARREGWEVGTVGGWAAAPNERARAQVSSIHPPRRDGSATAERRNRRPKPRYLLRWWPRSAGCPERCGTAGRVPAREVSRRWEGGWRVGREGGERAWKGEEPRREGKGAKGGKGVRGRRREGSAGTKGGRAAQDGGTGRVVKGCRGGRWRQHRWSKGVEAGGGGSAGGQRVSRRERHVPQRFRTVAR